MKRKTSILFLAALMSVLIISCNKEQLDDLKPQQQTSGFFKDGPVKGFQVVGNRLKDGFGSDFVMRGINYPLWYWKLADGTDLGGAGSFLSPTVMPVIKSYNANIVRVVCYTTTTPANVTKVIDACLQNNLIAIVEIQDFTGKSTLKELDSATNFYVKNKNLLIGKEDKVIINIANEWSGTDDNWKTGYMKAITTLRNAGLNHTIIVDANNWGQGYAVIPKFGLDVFNSDPKKNTMFSIHMYGGAGKDEATIKTAINGALDKGLAVCIGEFGWKHSDGDVDEATIMSYCKEKGVGWLAWSWTANGNPVAYLDMVTNAAGTNLTAWGDTIINGLNGLRATSKMCSVFTKLDVPGFSENPLASAFNVSPLNIDTNFANFAVFGKYSTYLNDHVRCYNQDRTDYSSVGAGTRYYVDDPATSINGNMILGTRVFAKDVICGLPNLWLRDPGSHISGNIRATGVVNGHVLTDYVHTGTILQNLYPSYTHIGQLLFANYTHGFTSDPSKPINIEPGQSPYTSYEKALPPGDYGDFNIKSNNAIYLSEGHYSFKSFNTEPDVEIFFPTTGIVRIIIDNGMTMKSRTRMLSMINGEKKGANPANILFMIGGDNSTVEISNQVNWRGTLAAPDSYVNINSNDENDYSDGTLSDISNPKRYETYSSNGEIYGAIWGRDVIVHQWTNIYFVRFNWGKVYKR